jgi:hypothetical protein
MAGKACYDAGFDREPPARFQQQQMTSRKGSGIDIRWHDVQMLIWTL